MSRTESYATARDVTVTGQAADAITFDCTSSDGVTVQLVPMTPGDEQAADRIRGAEVRQSGASVEVRLPQGHGGGHVQGGTTVIQGGNHALIQSWSGRGNTVIVNGRVVSDGDSGPINDTSVYAPGGSVVVTGSGNVVSSHGDVAFHPSARGARVTQDFSGATFSGGSLGGSVGGGAVRVIVSAPSGGSLSATTVSGSIIQRGRAGTVTAKTVSGDIRCDTTGPLDLKTTSGDVSSTGAAGGGRVKTVSGDVSVRTTTDTPVQVTTVSGDIHGMGAVIPRTTSGDIRCI